MGLNLYPHIAGCLVSLAGAHQIPALPLSLKATEFIPPLHTEYLKLGGSKSLSRTIALTELLDLGIPECYWALLNGSSKWFSVDISCHRLTFAGLKCEMVFYQFVFTWSVELKLMHEFISLMFLLIQNTYSYF